MPAIRSAPAIRPVPSALAGRTVLLVGGSSGIGLATARLVREHDGHVLLVGRHPDRLDGAQRLLMDLDGGGSVRTAVADVTDESGLSDVITGLDELHHVVVTAAAVPTGHVLSNATSQLAPAVDSRLWGAVTVARAAAPALPPGGSITLTSGSYVSRPQSGTAVVTAGLAALEGLVSGLAVELAGDLVRVNAVRPGPIDTPLLRAGHGFTGDEAHSAAADAAVAGTGARLLVGRVGTAEEAAAAVVFLMVNHFVTGAVVPVDGGVNLT